MERASGGALVAVLAFGVCTWMAQVGVCDEGLLQDAMQSLKTEIQQLDLQIQRTQREMAVVKLRMDELARQVEGSADDLKLKNELSRVNLVLAGYGKRLAELQSAKRLAMLNLSRLEQRLLGPQPEPPDSE